jgi:hypothetical protein
MAAEGRKLTGGKWIVTKKCLKLTKMRSKRFGRLRTLAKEKNILQTVSNDLPKTFKQM